MADQSEQLLSFQPRWWWDPVPPWIVDHLDKQILVELAGIHAQHQVNVLQSQLEAAQRAAEVMQKAR